MYGREGPGARCSGKADRARAGICEHEAREAARLDPSLAAAYAMLSEIEETRGHWAAAGDLIQKAAMLDPASLPVAGAEQAERLLDPKHPANQMIDRRRL